MRKIHVIFGPTASGKTKLAYSLAQQFSAPMISFDSRKVYKELDIGTNKYETVKFVEQSIFGINLFYPMERISAHSYRERLAQQLMDQPDFEKNESFVFWGGTGLYIDALMFGLPLGNEKSAARDVLNALSVDELSQKAQKINTKEFEKLTESDKKNPRRLIRFIEKKTAPTEVKPFTEEEKYIHNLFNNAEVVLYLPKLSRQDLYARINERLGEYITAGWVGEVLHLLQKYGQTAPALSIMGYKEMVDYVLRCSLSGETVDSTLEKIRLEHRRYAKRQLTWATRYQKPLTDLYPDKRTSPAGIVVKEYDLGGKLLKD